MRKLILLDLKPRRVNHVLTHSSTPTAEASIKPIQIYAPSGSITSTMIGVIRRVCGQTLAKVRLANIEQ